MFLPFQSKLHKATFIERPNRFIIHCKLFDTNEVVPVHLPDPGRLKELLIKGVTVYLEFHDKKERKTKWSAILVEDKNKNTYVSLKTTLANDLIEHALKHNMLSEFHDFEYIQKEYTKGNSRWDFLLKKGEQLCVLEVKSVTFLKDEVGYFPDAVSKRAKKHVEELMAINEEEGWMSAILFVAQRNDINSVKPAFWIDESFTHALQQASKNNVMIAGRNCSLALDGVKLGNSIPVLI